MNNGECIRAFCSDEQKAKMLDKKFLSFIDHYRTELYSIYYGKNHAYLKLNQLRHVHDQLYSFFMNIGKPDDIQEILTEMAISFFERVPSNEHNINHFVAGNMLEVRFYDCGLY